MNIGALSLTSDTTTVTTAELVRGGSPMSATITVKLYAVCDSKSKEPFKRSTPPTGSTENRPKSSLRWKKFKSDEGGASASTTTKVKMDNGSESSGSVKVYGCWRNCGALSFWSKTSTLTSAEPLTKAPKLSRLAAVTTNSYWLTCSRSNEALVLMVPEAVSIVKGTGFLASC